MPVVLMGLGAFGWSAVKNWFDRPAAGQANTMGLPSVGAVASLALIGSIAYFIYRRA